MCHYAVHLNAAREVLTKVTMKLTILNETLILFKLSKHYESLSVLLKSFWFPPICISLPLSSFAGLPVHRSLWKEGSKRKFSSWLELTEGPAFNGLLLGVWETEQLQPLNKICVFHVTLIHWADKHLCYWTYWSLHLVLKPKWDLYQQSRGAVSLLRTSLCPCIAMLDLALSCTSAGWWQTPEALAEGQTHPSLCVFDLWLPF